MNRHEDEHDERIHLRDRGVGRDIGRNPAFAGDMPRTRQTVRQESAGLQVGGYGTRDQEITSFAATAVGITASGVAVGGGSSLRGFTVIAPGTTGFVLFRDGQNGPILAACALPFATVYLGDIGVNFNSLYVDVRDAAMVVQDIAITGSVTVGTVE